MPAGYTTLEAGYLEPFLRSMLGEASTGGVPVLTPTPVPASAHVGVVPVVPYLTSGVSGRRTVADRIRGWFK